MTEFKREERYIVVKRSRLSADEERRIMAALPINGAALTNCVVIESDWPEYEPVWAMLRARVMGDKEIGR